LRTIAEDGLSLVVVIGLRLLNDEGQGVARMEWMVTSARSSGPGSCRS
jgi:hypothetical protein